MELVVDVGVEVDVVGDEEGRVDVVANVWGVLTGVSTLEVSARLSMVAAAPWTLPMASERAAGTNPKLLSWVKHAGMKKMIARLKQAIMFIIRSQKL